MPSSTLGRRIALASALALLLGALPTAYMKVLGGDFPADTKPEGAYLRIALAVRDERVEQAFAYLETEAQWALHSMLEYEQKSHALIARDYPEPDRARLLPRYEMAARAADAPAYFAAYARAKGLLTRLSRDLSGIAAVETQGERAVVQTARGTRYPFRKRDNGIWGLTIFTAELTAEAQRAARDHGLVEKAAGDYAAARDAAKGFGAKQK